MYERRENIRHRLHQSASRCSAFDDNISRGMSRCIADVSSAALLEKLCNSFLVWRWLLSSSESPPKDLCTHPKISKISDANDSERMTAYLYEASAWRHDDSMIGLRWAVERSSKVSRCQSCAFASCRRVIRLKPVANII